MHRNPERDDRNPESGALSRSGTTSSSGCKPPGLRALRVRILPRPFDAASTTPRCMASHSTSLRAQGKTASRRLGVPETRGASPRGPISRPRRSVADRLYDMEEMPVRFPPRASSEGLGMRQAHPARNGTGPERGPWEFDSPAFLAVRGREVRRTVSHPGANGAPSRRAGSSPVLSIFRSPEAGEGGPSFRMAILQGRVAKK